MSIIDKLLQNGDTMEKGLKEILGFRRYIIASDKQDNIICQFYDMDTGNTLINEFLKRRGISQDDVVIRQESIRGKEQQRPLIPYKIVILNGDLALYKDVVELSRTKTLKNFTDDNPKYGLNTYETIE